MNEDRICLRASTSAGLFSRLALISDASFEPGAESIALSAARIAAF